MNKCCGGCCNFDYINVDMGGMARCLTTNTFTYCEESAEECKFYNVTDEKIIVLPCKLGTTYYFIGYYGRANTKERTPYIGADCFTLSKIWRWQKHPERFFFTREAAEQALEVVH